VPSQENGARGAKFCIIGRQAERLDDAEGGGKIRQGPDSAQTVRKFGSGTTRVHSRKCCFAKISIQTFRDSMPLMKKTMLSQNLQTELAECQVKSCLVHFR